MLGYVCKGRGKHSLRTSKKQQKLSLWIPFRKNRTNLNRFNCFWRPLHTIFVAGKTWEQFCFVDSRSETSDDINSRCIHCIIIDALASFTDWHIKILKYLQQYWRLSNLTAYSTRCAADRKTRKTQKQNYRKIRTILYDWKTDDRIEAGFSLNNRAKRVENRSGWHHARSYRRLRYIRLQFKSVRPFFFKHFFIVFHGPEWSIRDSL